ncbi:WD40 repeat-like protein [Mycena albidolilacea]|uniref:WD40 repeat-like protein n=1 Tax=Mycena albidolilacea TaxID=1033008 RepID=A0AAD6Z076_9AGAR|nr:WD40 repeat-like protein [Mycena albidolilacea]
MAENSPVLRISSDDINCLVYAFLVDSGFKHTAFSLAMESRLSSSPNFSRRLPRGELVDLLSKALLYQEVECHWRADALARGCQAEFSLLQPHVCSLDPPRPRMGAWGQQQQGTRWPLGQSNRANASVGPNGVTPPPDNGKRKASPFDGADGQPAEKRAKRDPDADADEPMAIDSPISPSVLVGHKKLKPQGRQQGPGDADTNPDAILLLPGHEAEVFVLAFNPVRQSVLVTGSKDAVLNLWDLPYPPAITSPAFARAPGPPRRLLPFSSNSVKLGNGNPSVKMEDGNANVKMEDAADADVDADPSADLTALHWNSDGTLLAIASFDSVLRVCTEEGEMFFESTVHEGPIFAVRFSKDGRWLLTASLDNTACLWDVHAKRLNTQFRAHTGPCLDVEWISDSMFASCSADHSICLMEIGNARPIRRLDGHTNEVNQIKCNATGTHLVSCADDMTARVWRVRGDDGSSSSTLTAAMSSGEPGTAETAVVLIGHKHSVTSVGWCPDADRPAGTNEIIATASWDGTARLWDSVTGECLHVFEDHKLPVYALRFSPTGRWVATGSSDGWLHVYDVKARKLTWSWFAGVEKPGVYEIDWQADENLDRIALALECWKVAVIDVSKVPALQGKR